jgi:hypothetical protein
MLYRLDTIRVVPPREYIKAACHLIISFRLHSSNFLFRYLWTFRRPELPHRTTSSDALARPSAKSTTSWHEAARFSAKSHFAEPKLGQEHAHKKG